MPGGAHVTAGSLVGSLLLYPGPHINVQGVKSVEGLRLRLVDAKGQVVGRLASQIATILQVGTGRAGAHAVRGTLEGCLRATAALQWWRCHGSLLHALDN